MSESLTQRLGFLLHASIPRLACLFDSVPLMAECFLKRRVSLAIVVVVVPVVLMLQGVIHERFRDIDSTPVKALGYFGGIVDSKSSKTCGQPYQFTLNVAWRAVAHSGEKFRADDRLQLLEMVRTILGHTRLVNPLVRLSVSVGCVRRVWVNACDVGKCIDLVAPLFNFLTDEVRSLLIRANRCAKKRSSVDVYLDASLLE